MTSPLAGLPQVQAEHFRVPDPSQLLRPHASHPPRILLLYGSVRPRSFSRLLVEEAARLLQAMGAETRIFNPSGLPLPDDAPDTHPKVQELRELTLWSEGMVWCSPERHGAMTSIMRKGGEARSVRQGVGFLGFLLVRRRGFAGRQEDAECTHGASNDEQKLKIQ